MVCHLILSEKTKQRFEPVAIHYAHSLPEIQLQY